VTFAALALLLVCAVEAWLLFRVHRAAASLAREAETRKRAEQEARAASLAKGQFLANASHEIRTPMHGVLGMADLLLRGELSPAQREQVGLIRTSAEALLALVDDMLDLSRIEAGQLLLRPRDFHLRETVDEVVRLLAPRADAQGIGLRLDIAAEIPEALHGDPVRLRQVLINLVGNAIRHTREGFVAVTVERRGGGDGEGGPPRIRFEVQDTGSGIRPAVQARLFQRFARSESSASENLEGAGLGLVISKSIVELMGGEIGFESTYGAGSAFWFEVPQVAAQGATVIRQPLPGRREDGRAARSGARVLVVDDHPVNRVLVLAQLRELGYLADAAPSGRAALDLLAERSYDAVLLDCAMPEMDGFETCRRLRAREGEDRRRTPVIALTAFAMDGVREKCLAAGMDDFLGKPYRVEDLTAKVDLWVSLGPAAPESRSGGRLDERLTALQRLGESHGEAVLAQVVEAFLDQGARDLAAMAQALGEADGEAIAAAAHFLGGSSGILGAAELAACCAELETLARQGDLAACGPRLQAVEREYQAFAGRLAT
jgi:two-component system, sensor histidine kinase